ncbi:MAG: GGDEF domain-containing protein, partial [Nocardiopsis sp. BM-2018]
LRHAVRGYDLVGRWGGDEFVVILSGVADPDIAMARAASLSASVARPIESRPASTLDPAAPVTSARLGVGASVGVAMLGVHGDDLDTLLIAADAAMFCAKRAGASHAMAEAVSESRPVAPG